MIISDRHSNRPSLDPLRGGDLLSPQHLPWFLRHPEVYILILPAFGLISEMIPKFSQCIISGSDAMLIAFLITPVVGCIVRGHHTSMVGFDLDTRSYLPHSTTIILLISCFFLYTLFDYVVYSDLFLLFFLYLNLVIFLLFIPFCFYRYIVDLYSLHHYY